MTEKDFSLKDSPSLVTSDEKEKVNNSNKS